MQALRMHYANTLRKIHKDYADITQMFLRNYHTTLRKKLRKNYSNSLRTTCNYYANKFTQALRKYLLFTQ